MQLKLNFHNKHIEFLTWLSTKYFLSKGKTSKIGKAYELSRVVMEHPGDVLGSKFFDKLV